LGELITQAARRMAFEQWSCAFLSANSLLFSQSDAFHASLLRIDDSNDIDDPYFILQTRMSHNAKYFIETFEEARRDFGARISFFSSSEFSILHSDAGARIYVVQEVTAALQRQKSASSSDSAPRHVQIFSKDPYPKFSDSAEWIQATDKSSNVRYRGDTPKYIVKKIQFPEIPKSDGTRRSVIHLYTKFLGRSYFI
jgi:hypothetical protein